MKIIKKIVCILFVFVTCFMMNSTYAEAKNNYRVTNNRIMILDDIQKFTIKTTNTTSPGRKSPQCDSGGDLSLRNLIRRYWSLVTIFAPIGLIILTSIDMLKAIVSSDADQLNKSGKDALKRTIAVIILLFLPTILEIMLGWYGLDLCL